MLSGQLSITPLPYSSRAPKRVKMPNRSDTVVIDNPVAVGGLHSVPDDVRRLMQEDLVGE